MDSPRMTHADLLMLKRWNTPTVYNGWEQITRRNAAAECFNREETRDFMPQLGPMVGYAVTGTIRAMHPPREDAATLRATRLDWYRYVDAAPRPGVVVIQDLDQPPGFGAFWGEVHTAVHKGLGALGVVTDGSVRDLDVCAPGFQMLAGCVGPSHAWVRIEQFGLPVTVHGMTVHPGDLLHADRHGAVVIPHAVARRVRATADLLARREAVILEAARAPGFNADVLARAIGEADDIH